ncbi:MAG: deoxyribonuclease V [Gammaproteobacteria bacterium]|nr:deoxyribonuclease V [Gammaproteobacteria bacterium]
MPESDDLHHPWGVGPREARAIQERLRERVVTRDRLAGTERLAGVDVGFEEAGAVTRAAVVVLDSDTLEVVERSLVRRPTAFPYVPGLLSFREIPAILAALDGLTTPPQVLLCDGQGIAHPRRFGLAAHLGVLTDLPAVGVAKKRLVGSHGPVPQERGGWCSLEDDGQVIGAVLRTRQGVKPVYVSIGHRVSLETAVALVMSCTTRFRLPETTRAAHRLASVEKEGRS